MRMKMPLLAGAFCLAYATPAFACNFYFASTYMRVPARPSFGVGALVDFGDPSSIAISGDVAMKLGEKIVVRPGIGLCTYEVFDERQNDPFFGAGVAFNLAQNESMSLNLQSGISYQTLDGANVTVIPIGAAASFRASGPMSFYAGASLWWAQLDVDGGGSDSESDPVLFGGLQGNSGSLAWTLGAQLYMGEETDFGIVAGFSMNPGSSAIRRIGSVFRK
jgi:hypothetical protein